MKAQEIKFNHIENFQVNFYVGSYMYREPKIFSCENINAVEDAKKLILSLLKSDKNNSNNTAQKETFWATISIEKEVSKKLKYDEVFEWRIKMN